MDPFKSLKKAFRGAIRPRESRPLSTNKRIEALIDAGKLAEAEALLCEEAEQLKRQPSASRRYARSLVALAVVERRLGKPDAAKQHVESALELLSELQQTVDFIECLELQCAIALDLDESPARVAEWFERALVERERLGNQEPAEAAALFRRLSQALRGVGESVRAKRSAERMLELVRDRYGEEDLHFAESLLDLGQCQSSMEEHAQAAETIERALAIFESQQGRDSEQVARTLHVLASACQAADKLQEALGYYEKALQVRERQLGGNSEDLALLLMGLGSVHSQMGRYGPAVENLQQAVMRLEGTPDDRLGSALDRLGVTYLEFGRFEEAIGCLRRARNVWEAAPTRYQPAIEANAALLEDAIASLPEQRRLALGFDVKPPASVPPVTAAQAAIRQTEGRSEGVAETAQPVPSALSLEALSAALAAFVKADTLPAFPAFSPLAPNAIGARDMSLPDHRTPGLPLEFGCWPVMGPGFGTGGALYSPSIPGIAAPSGPVVRPDNLAAGALGAEAGYSPLHWSMVLGEGGGSLAMQVAGVPRPPDIPKPIAVLNGWDELGFDFLPTTHAA